MRRMKNYKSMHCLAVSSKVNIEIVDESVISRFSVKIVQATMLEIILTRMEEMKILIVVSWYMSSRTASN
jgi:hypothetical protein